MAQMSLACRPLLPMDCGRQSAISKSAGSIRAKSLQERELSIALLEEWLVKFKFKNWKSTEGTGKKVTNAMRVERARDIAMKPEPWQFSATAA